VNVATFAYALARTPAIRVVEVVVRHPNGTGSWEPVRLTVDTGSDQTVLPGDVILRIRAPYKTIVPVTGFGGGGSFYAEYDVELAVASKPPVVLPVLAAPPAGPIVLGRDVLNRYRVVLDGPNLTLEIT
jgi:hypothetical protein